MTATQARTNEPDATRRASRRTLLAFLVPLGLFLALTLYQIHLPGPNYDEATEAKPAVQLVRGQPVEAHRGAVLHLFGRDWPLMVVDYVGGLNIYGLTALFKIGGIGVTTMRLWPIAVGVVILWLTFRLGIAFFGLRGAMIAALLLAVQPSNVFFTRQGIYVTNTTIAFSLGIVLALWKLARSGNLRWWYLAAFLAGLGLWAKFIVLWPLVAIAVLAPLVWVLRASFGLEAADGFSPRRLVQPRALVFALGGFLLGVSPLILFNLQTGATIAHFLGTVNESYYGVQNAAYLDNLVTRWRQLGDFLRGDHFWYLGGNFRDALARPAWLLGFVIAFVVLIARWRALPIRALALRSLFFYAFTALLLLQSPLTPTALWYTHLAMFSPYLALGIAGSWDLLFGRASPRGARALALLFVFVLGASGLRADIGYHRALTASGGYADHSDAAYRLTSELQSRGITQPYALDWGFDAPIILISQGDVNPIELFGYERVDAPPSDFSDLLRPLLRDPNAVFLLHAPDRTNFQGRREALQATAAELGLSLETIAVIRERSGAPHTEIVRVVAGG